MKLLAVPLLLTFFSPSVSLLMLFLCNYCVKSVIVNGKK